MTIDTAPIREALENCVAFINDRAARHEISWRLLEESQVLVKARAALATLEASPQAAQGDDAWLSIELHDKLVEVAELQDPECDDGISTGSLVVPVGKALEVIRPYLRTTPPPSQQPDGLLPCPFCGGSSKLTRSPTHGTSIEIAHNLGCAIYHHDQGDYHFDDLGDAIAAWNTRTPAPEVPCPSVVDEELVEVMAVALCRADVDDYGEMDIKTYTPMAKAALAALRERGYQVVRAG